MEVFQTNDHYIVLNGDYSLWCSRKHGKLEAKSGKLECKQLTSISFHQKLGLRILFPALFCQVVFGLYSD